MKILSFLFALCNQYQTLQNNEIESDLEAIQAANRGISTKNLPNAENRGYGIITSKKMLIDGLGGSFIMMSGNARNLPGINLTTDWIYFEKGHWVGIKGNLPGFLPCGQGIRGQNGTIRAKTQGIQITDHIRFSH